MAELRARFKGTPPVGLKRVGPMYCPVCGAQGAVIDSHDQRDGAVVVRRRRCLACRYSWTSEEHPALAGPEPHAAGGPNRGGKRVSGARYYLGFRVPLGSEDQSDECLVYALALGGSWRKLYLRQGLRYHSPTGFNWGYAGSGPAELARHLLMHACGKPSLSERPDLYQEFKAEVVAKMAKIWMLDGDYIRGWVADHDHGDPNAPPA